MTEVRYRLSHRTSYSYTNSVDTAYHLAHLRARDFRGQRILGSEIVIAEPKPSLASQRIDHFGNHIDVYRIDQPHTRFEIEVKGEIEVALPVPPDAATTPPWEEMRETLRGDGFPKNVEASEFVHESPLIPVDESVRDYGAASLTPGRPILEAARELTSRIKADFEYLPGSTDISTPLHEVFAGRSGVCQDFAHVEIAALRAHGLAARYVSGYVRTVRSDDEVAMRGADASHAWVMVWCGEQAGWVHLDPTNDLVAHEDHVIVAWGRDFSDVSPLRGVILGGGAHTYGVAVQLVPLT
jgi:transglutaminase-like putative cysteine protease